MFHVRRTAVRRCPVSLHRVAAAAALLGAHLGASAQQSTAPDANALPEAGKLPTVTVTAERRRENARDVPNSVSVINPEQLDAINTGGQDLRGLAGRVPNLNIESSFGRAFPRLYIRGYGNTDFRLNASQPVSLVYDDVVQENPILKGFPVFDVDQIEVLRGPQGALYGQSSIGGAIILNTKQPKLHVFDASGDFSAGNYNLFRERAEVNIPINDQLAARLSIQKFDHDGFTRNVQRFATGG